MVDGADPLDRFALEEEEEDQSTKHGIASSAFPQSRSFSRSMIDALQTAALQQQPHSKSSLRSTTAPKLGASALPPAKRVTAGEPDVLTPQCHRCHHRKLGRGFASCENGHAHHFCERCVHNSFGTDFQQLVE